MSWLFKQDGNDVGSLKWICDHIGYHVDDIRTAAIEYINAAEDEDKIKKYHKPKGTRCKPRRRVFHTVGRSTAAWYQDQLAKMHGI